MGVLGDRRHQSKLSSLRRDRRGPFASDGGPHHELSAWKTTKEHCPSAGTVAQLKGQAKEYIDKLEELFLEYRIHNKLEALSKAVDYSVSE